MGPPMRSTVTWLSVTAVCRGVPVRVSHPPADVRTGAARCDCCPAAVGSIDALRSRKAGVMLLIFVRRDATGDAWVSLHGEVDLATVDQLDRDIAAVISAEQARRIVIDLSELAFIDSRGISSLLRGRRLADAAGKPYRITGAEGRVRQLLDVCGAWSHLAGPLS